MLNKKIKDDDIIITCDEKEFCYEHIARLEALRAYRKERKENEKIKRQLQIAEYFIKCIADRRTNNIPYYMQAQTTLKMIKEIT